MTRDLKLRSVQCSCLPSQPPSPSSHRPSAQIFLPPMPRFSPPPALPGPDGRYLVGHIACLHRPGINNTPDRAAAALGLISRPRNKLGLPRSGDCITDAAPLYGPSSASTARRAGGCSVQPKQSSEPGRRYPEAAMACVSRSVICRAASRHHSST